MKAGKAVNANAHRKQRGVKTTTFTGPGNWLFCGAHGGSTCSPGDKEYDPHNLTEGFRQRADIRQRQNYTLFWKWVFSPGKCPHAHHSRPRAPDALSASQTGPGLPPNSQGLVLARASVPAQKMRVACAELSATKRITQWRGRGDSIKRKPKNLTLRSRSQQCDACLSVCRV